MIIFLLFSGITGNKKANKLARVGSSSPKVRPEPALGETCKIFIKEWRNQYLNKVENTLYPFIIKNLTLCESKEALFFWAVKKITL